MKITVKIGVLAALVWIIIKMIFHVIKSNDTPVSATIFINMFILLVGIATGLFLHKKKEGFLSGNAMSDIKAAMTVAIPYSILLSIFIYFYYKDINPEYNEIQIEKAQLVIEKDVNDPVILKKMKAENEAFEVMSKEKIRKQLLQGPKNFYNPKSTALISLLALMMLSTIYSIFITIVYRKVMFKGIK